MDLKYFDLSIDSYATGKWRLILIRNCMRKQIEGDLYFLSMLFLKRDQGGQTKSLDFVLVENRLVLKKGRRVQRTNVCDVVVFLLLPPLPFGPLRQSEISGSWTIFPTQIECYAGLTDWNLWSPTSEHKGLLSARLQQLILFQSLPFKIFKEKRLKRRTSNEFKVEEWWDGLKILRYYKNVELGSTRLRE